jgi:hypothetical protein
VDAVQDPTSLVAKVQHDSRVRFIAFLLQRELKDRLMTAMGLGCIKTRRRAAARE